MTSTASFSHASQKGALQPPNMSLVGAMTWCVLDKEAVFPSSFPEKVTQKLFSQIRNKASTLILRTQPGGAFKGSRVLELGSSSV